MKNCGRYKEYSLDIKEKEIERWIVSNTFLCPHGLGIISPEQCKANRERPDDRIATENILPKPFVCKDCNEWADLSNKVYKKRQLGTVKKIICKNCKNESYLFEDNLCYKCYWEKNREKILQNKKRKKRKKQR